MLTILNDDDDSNRMWLGWKLERFAARNTYGRGKGSPGFRRKVSSRFKAVDVFETIKIYNTKKLEKLMNLSF